MEELHTDVRRLAVLTFPKMAQADREGIACDCFIDALVDPDFILRVRQQNPKTLDEALRVAQRLEIWVKKTENLQSEDRKFKEDRKVREVAKAENSDQTTELATKAQMEALKKDAAEYRKLTEEYKKQTAKEIAEYKKQIGQLEGMLQAVTKTNTESPSSNPRMEPSPYGTIQQRRPGGSACYGCGDTQHLLRECPRKTFEEKQQLWHQYGKPSMQRRVRPLNEKRAHTCVWVKNKKRRISALLDTGSDITIIGTDLAKKLRWKIHPTEVPSVRAANGESMRITGAVKEDLTIGGRRITSEVLASPDLNGMIVGLNWLRSQGRFEWDFVNDRIKFPDGGWIGLHEEREEAVYIRRIYVAEDTILPPAHQTNVPIRVAHGSWRDRPFVGITENTKVPNLSYVFSARTVLPPKFTDIRVPVVNLDDRSQTLAKGTKLGVLERVEKVEDVENNDMSPSTEPESLKDRTKALKRTEVLDKMMQALPKELNSEQRRKIYELLKNNEGIFSVGEHDIERTQLTEYRIDTGDQRPIRQPLRRQPFQHLDIIDKQVEDMKAAGIIEPAASPWASNVVLVKKKDGSLRFCVDYRRLNAITYKDSYPLPLIDNCLNALSGSSWFSTLDLRSGYYNIPIAADDRDKSAFVTRRGCFRFTVMSFGLTCAPSVFQRLMDFVLSGLHYLTCLVYIDDIIVFGKTFDQQLERLGEVFNRIAQANLKLKPSKCSLFRRRVEFLGHVITEEGIAMQEDKVEAINTWPSPKNLTELRAFVGICGYYRRFVKDFSSIASPMFQLMKKGVQWKWTKESQEAFDMLKTKLISEPILALPTNEGTFVLDTDASDVGLGAVLSQIQSGEEKVIAFASRTLSGPELKYEVTRKELLAVVYGLKQFRQYLLGRHIILRTDHAALSWLRRTPEPMPQLARWLTFVEQFDYEVQHREGKKHGNADGLSRKPTLGEGKEERVGQEIDTEDNEDSRVTQDSKVRTVEKSTKEVDTKVRESPHEGSDMPNEGNSLQQRQRLDKDFGRLVSLRQASSEVPEYEALSVESEATKKLCLQWENLEIYNGLVYRRLRSQRGGEPDYLQLLVPRSDVEDVLRQCHAGVVGGHFGIRRTQDQVKRRYYWPSWKQDTERFCRRCLECNTYHRGKLKRQGPLKPVLAGAPFERWYICLLYTSPSPRDGLLSRMPSSA